MLFLLFHLGAQRYALDVGQVAAVLPMVAIRPIPHAPPGVAGLINYHGAPLPVIDLSALTLGQPAPRRLDTRIVLVHYHQGVDAARLLGLIAERATETARLDCADFVPSGVTTPAAPHLGTVTAAAQGLVQRIEVNQLLPQALRDLLFRQAAES